MSTIHSAGERLWQAMGEESPLQVVGTINAFSALQARKSGFKAIYLSGAGVANASFGFPDLGITSLNDVCEDVRRICGAVELPLLVDADTGWGQAFMIARTAHDLCVAGAAGMHMEDQVGAKRCGHRPGKELVAAAEMADRIKAAVDGRPDDRFVVMARTDAHAVEGQQAAIDRALHYVEAGADMIFAEALTELDEYRDFVTQVGVPVLANITEFGKTPLFTVAELADAGADDDRAHQAGDPTDGVHDTRAGEVDVAVSQEGVRTERCEPAVAVPRPVHYHRVDERRY
ncbi:MAG: methylisocitrate lyase, partial [Proteobacteria bacterium]|nr:methylisocitrate lyase [Pseudomonadota bacterium]